MTPTTAAVIADKSGIEGFTPLSFSANGAPRKIQRKHGVNVTQVASSPPSVPAKNGEKVPGSESRHEAHELKHHDERPGCGFRHTQTVQHLSGFQPPIMLDRLLGNISEHSVGTAKGHHRHLAEEDCDLTEDVWVPRVRRSDCYRNEPERQPNRSDAQEVAELGRVCSSTSSPRRAVGGRNTDCAGLRLARNSSARGVTKFPMNPAAAPRER